MLFLFCLFLSPSANAEVVDRIVSIVNDELITQSDMSSFAKKLSSGGLTDDLLIPDESYKQAVLKDSSKQLNLMIDERLLDGEVKRQGLSVPFERIEQEVRNIAKRNNLTRDELKAALVDKGVDFAEYQQFIRTGLERQSLVEKNVTSKIKISEDEVSSLLAKRSGDNSQTLFEYSLSHILFLAEKGGLEAARRRAEYTYEKLKAGESFESLATDHSEDPSFSSGGALGVFKSGEFQRELEAVIEKMSVGDFSQILPLKGGFHIVRLTKKRAVLDPQTEKERGKIRNELYDLAYRKQLASWLEQLRNDAFIKINK